MKYLVLGIYAHVDAGKTTLSEAMLYLSGQLRKAGRVDHGDSFLDSDSIERERGITIFSKQARFELPGLSVTLLDTPGHVDFSAETERTLQVLDYAVLVISATDGVQSHTRTLWQLLKKQGIPVFIFVNKMDLAGADASRILSQLRSELDSGCVDFSAIDTSQSTAPLPDDLYEEIALVNDSMLEEFSENGLISDSSITNAVAKRQLFPVIFGSALKMEHVDELLRTMSRFARSPYENDANRSSGANNTSSPDQFAARVYKIGRDNQGNRLTYMKITGGRLSVKQVISYGKSGSAPSDSQAAAGSKFAANDSGSAAISSNSVAANSKSSAIATGPAAANSKPAAKGDTPVSALNSTNTVKSPAMQEKIDQIRLYSGEKYILAEEALPGQICAVTGLTATSPGMGLGLEPDGRPPVLTPVMSRKMELPPDTSAPSFFRKLKELEEEDPSLHLVWDSQKQEISARIMGAVQIEVLTRVIKDRFGVTVHFGPESILYRETIAAPVEGVGHFEPLRHYAEVHLLMEPGDPGSGITAASAVSEDVLDLHWQRLILTHVLEREHLGVLTGSPITDIKITLVGGRAHLKHTEGGDFREATYRAIRQGLRSAISVLLEPWYKFLLDVPADCVGRALTDLSARHAEMSEPEFSEDGTRTRIRGRMPVSAVSDYAQELAGYSRGEGALALVPDGYDSCLDPENVIEAIHYDPDADTENPASSVFCAHGAGFLVPWDLVPEYMHLPYAAGDLTGYSSDAGYETEEEDLFDYARRREMEEARKKAALEARQKRNGGGSETETPDEKELSAIYSREFGMNRDGTPLEGSENARKRKRWASHKPVTRTDAPRQKLDKQGNPIYPKKDTREEYLIVDGYNIIHDWDELRDLASVNIDSARGRLLDILSNYQGYTGKKVTVVFDAYRTDRPRPTVSGWQNLEVVFTRSNETADAYIERSVHDLIGKYKITVATSDAMEQLTVMSLGALRLPARLLLEEIRAVTQG